MSLYQISWRYSRENYKPLTFPPNPMILGWWKLAKCSETETELVAIVKGCDLEEVASYVVIDWPELMSFKEINYCVKLNPPFKLSPKLRLNNWIRERLSEYLINETT